ncbi:MAG: hypothetical protein ACRED2_00030, partial [Methylocella sp.]
MKSSKTKQANKTKQAKQPGTRKAKVSKKSAVLKAQRAATARALARKKLAANKSSRKTKTKSAGATRHANSLVATKPAARKRTSTARAAPRASNTIRAAKKGAARSTKRVLASATRAHRGASARANAKSVSGKTARPASVNKPARGTPVVTKKTPAIESHRVAAKRATALHRAVESPTRTVQKNTAASKAAAAILALKQNAARLTEVRKRAAAIPPAGRPAGHASKVDLASKERMALIKKSEQKISTGSALEPMDANVARVPTKRAAAGSPSPATAKGSGKPFAAKITAKTQDSQTPPSIEKGAEAKPGEHPA